MKTKGSKIIIVILALLVLCYVGYQVMLIFYAPYRTQTAVLYKVSDQIKCSGVAVRDETVLDSVVGGAYVYRISDGDKVAKNEVIADVYGTSDAITNYLLLKNYVEERELLIELANISVGTVDAEGSAQAVYDSLAAFSNAISDNALSDTKSHLRELYDSYGAYSQSTGKQVDFSERITWLNHQIAALSSASAQPTSSITAPDTGYFVTSVDGFESSVSSKSVLQMSVAEIEALTVSQPAYADGAKLVSSYEWYYVVPMSESDALRFRVGASLRLNFSYAGVTNLPVMVSAKLTDNTSDKVVVVLRCSSFNSATASLRLEQATVSFSSYQGIKVERSSLHLHNGELGVYIKYGTIVRFRKIEVIFETEDYVVSSAGLSGSGMLALYDEVLVAGRNLTVGKELP